MIQELTAFYNKELILIVFRIVVTVCIGFLLAWLLRKTTRKWLEQHTTHHITAIVSSFVWYAAVIVIVINIMHELGFNLSALLGAAGVIGVAIGFAAQTSISNIISGVFLIMEHSFEVGDYLEHEKVSGVVESIGLLSVNLRTYDNILIRVPNEMLLKNVFVNTTAYPVRRLRFRVRISSTESVEAAKQIINDAIVHSPILLKDPAVRVELDGTTNWSSELAVRVWVSKDDVIAASEQLIKQIKQRADAANLSMAITRLANID